MLRDKGHIDKIFSEGLKDLSVQPKPELWVKINADMKRGRRKKRAAVIYITLAAAASLFLLLTLSNNALFEQEFDFNQVEVISDAVVIPQQNQYVMSRQNQVKELEQTLHVPPVLNRNLKISNHTNTTQNQIAFVKPIQKRDISMQMVLPELQSEALELSPLAMKPFEKETQEKKIAGLSRLQDSLTIAYNMRMLKQFDREESKEKEWSILGQVSSAYSSYTGDKSGSNSENGLLSVGGGVKVNWQTGKKLAIQTGIIYNKFGQQLGSSGLLYDNALFSADMKNSPALGAAVQTSAGLIKRKSSPVAYSDALTNSYASSSPDMIQSFEALEIPFIVRYSLLDKKFGLHVSGGVSTNLMIGNRVYDKSTRQTLGETSGIRTTNFSTSFSLGMEYELNSKFSLSMEPSFKYYLNSINKDSSYDFKPYSIGLSSGIRYKF